MQFSYAGFEQQPKSFKNPKIVCLNVELELSMFVGILDNAGSQH